MQNLWVHWLQSSWLLGIRVKQVGKSITWWVCVKSERIFGWEGAQPQQYWEFCDWKGHHGRVQPLSWDAGFGHPPTHSKLHPWTPSLILPPNPSSPFYHYLFTVTSAFFEGLELLKWASPFLIKNKSFSSVVIIYSIKQTVSHETQEEELCWAKKRGEKDPTHKASCLDRQDCGHNQGTNSQYYWRSSLNQRPQGSSWVSQEPSS